MIKEIRYGGLSAQPNEYISEDGESALLMNLVPEKDGLQPMGMGVTSGIRIPSGMKIFTHKPEGNTNYIAYGNRKVQWVADEFESYFDPAIDIVTTDSDIVDITSLGNVIIVSTTTAMHYARWDAQNDAYIYLGTQVPKVEMEFGLQLNLESYLDETKKLTYASGKNITTDEFETTLVTPYLNYETTLLEDETDEDGYFISRRFEGKTAIISGLKFSKGYEYKINVLHNWSYRSPQEYGEVLHTTLYFKTIEGNTIFSMTPDNRANNYITFFAESDYENINIFITEYSNFKPTTPLRFALTVYKGLKRPDVLDEIKTIEQTNDNFNHITGLVNRFINERGPLNNRFIYPFFIRYGVKLYDQNYSFISPPILMTPNSGYTPCLDYSKWDPENSGARLRIGAWSADIFYISKTDDIFKWKDLIVGVDIFVSRPIYTYNQGVEFSKDNDKLFIPKYSNSNSFGIGIGFNGDLPLTSNMPIKVFTEEQLDKQLAVETIASLEVAPFAIEEILENASNVDNYYLIKSFKLEEIKDGIKTIIKLDDGVLTNLATRVDIKDIYRNTEYLNAKLLVYNNRLNLFNGAERMPNLTPPNLCRGIEVKQDDPWSKQVVFLFVKTKQGERVLRLESNYFDRVISAMGWFYYPNEYATEVVVFFFNSISRSWRKGVYPLKAHNYLNGCYWIGDTLTSYMIDQSSPSSEDELNEYNSKVTTDTLSMQNTIYTSEAENPWVFSIGNSRSIGDGELIGVASATKALSEGQYGQFPLYAFTSEGVWSLSVTSNGLFNPAQPVTRDVCISADSITQLDQAVLFATNRGVMMLEGSNTACITDNIESELPFDLSKLKGGDKLAEMSGIKEEAFNIDPFQEFIEGCSMVYDYTHQRIILYNKEYDYAYVFSLESKAWGIMESNIADKINSYPDAIVVTKDGELLNLSQENSAKMKGFMVSRALKLDDGDILKTINTIVQRGDFNRGDVATILWGSRDLKNWHLVWSSKDHYMRGFRGTPYKYYRIGAITNLGKDESLIGASINYEIKQTNQIR